MFYLRKLFERDTDKSFITIEICAGTCTSEQHVTLNCVYVYYTLKIFKCII
jgi:hypothetical protein